MTTTVSATPTAQSVPHPVRLYRMVTPDHECPWGQRAVTLLQQKEIDFEDIHLTSSEAAADFKTQHQVPRVLLNTISLPSAYNPMPRSIPLRS